MSKAIPSRVNYLLNVKHLLACFEAMPRFAVIASVLLKPGSSSPGWVHQCPQNLWDLIPHSAWQSCSCPWWEPTLAWAPGAEALVSSQVVEEELQSFPRRLEEQPDTCPTSPRVAAHQEPWSGKWIPFSIWECQQALELKVSLSGLWQTELLWDVRGMWFVQQEVDEGHWSSSRLCGFELHLHTHWNPFSPKSPEFYWSNNETVIQFPHSWNLFKCIFFWRSTSPLWFILKWLLEGVILVMKC